MGITPMEINNKEFKRSFRGYDIDDVDDFLEQVVEDYEKLFKENTALREKLNSLTEKLEYFTKIEATLQNTLVLAQGAADQAKTNSQKESELIVKNANDTAQKIIDQAHTEAVKISGEYERTKQEFQLFKSKYKNFIQTQLDLLSDIDTITNDTRNSSNSDRQSEGFKKSAEVVSKFRETQPVNEPQPKPVDEFKLAVNQYKAMDFNPKSIDFRSKPLDIKTNFDDFDDDDTSTY